MIPLVIPPPIVATMIAHARAELPNEMCGFLAGTVVAGVGRVTAFLPVVNELASPTAFRTEPRSTLAAYRRMRAAGTDVLAVVHSHPASAPIPSRRDLAENTYGPGVAWVIVGLAGAEPEVRTWWLSETASTEAVVSSG